MVVAKYICYVTDMMKADWIISFKGIGIQYVAILRMLVFTVAILAQGTLRGDAFYAALLLRRFVPR